ncbi:hypothetical protein [Stenotrophomonas nitritireducens]|uniref:hypothetical protein n=1 Tax=Stenotrophomonas nitritireducens TaxID=83617 RepID=UPI00128F3393|nr:hypothetical protein [Stenotrophomonas nitritireducens]
MIAFILILVALVVIGAVTSIVVAQANKRGIGGYISGIPELSGDYIRVGEDGRTALVIDESRLKIALVYRSGEGIFHRLLSYGDVISAQIHEDGFVVTSTSRASQLAGAAVGGVLLGGVGAVVGAVTGKQTQVAKVKRVELRLVVSDVARPIHDVVFQDVESKRDGLIYQHSIQQAREWLGRFEAVIHRSKATPRED